MNGYIALYIGKRYEVYAHTSHDAWERAVNHFKAPKGKRHLISIHLAERNTNGIVTEVEQTAS